MNSLRQKLNDLIASRGYMSYGEVVQFAAEEGYKASNAERRLRHSESPDILPVEGTSRRGTPYITGYRWNPSAVTEKEAYHSPPKIIKRNPNPFQVSETVARINQIPAFAGKAEQEMKGGLFN